MSETAPEPRPAGGGKKILGLKPTTFYLAVGGAVIVGLVFYWWRNYQAANSSATTAAATGSAGTGATDYSGQLSTIQTELESLMQQQGVSTSTTSGNGGGGGGWSGYSGGGTGGDSSGSGSSSSGSSSSGTSGSSGSSSTGVNGAGSSSVSSAPAAPSGGRVTQVNNNTATIAWNGNGAAKWGLKITGPGAINGHTATVTVPQGVYSGLEAGHTYDVTVTPYSASGQAGPSGVITIKTTTGK